MSKKTTRWFPVNVRPTRPGLYQVHYLEDSFAELIFRVWTGREWTYENGMGTLFSTGEGDKWRGLAEQPK